MSRDHTRGEPRPYSWRAETILMARNHSHSCACACCILLISFLRNHQTSHFLSSESYFRVAGISLPSCAQREGNEKITSKHFCGLCKLGDFFSSFKIEALCNLVKFHSLTSGNYDRQAEVLTNQSTNKTSRIQV